MGSQFAQIAALEAMAGLLHKRRFAVAGELAGQSARHSTASATFPATLAAQQTSPAPQSESSSQVMRALALTPAAAAPPPGSTQAAVGAMQEKRGDAAGTWQQKLLPPSQTGEEASKPQITSVVLQFPLASQRPALEVPLGSQLAPAGLGARAQELAGVAQLPRLEQAFAAGLGGKSTHGLSAGQVTGGHEKSVAGIRSQVPVPGRHCWQSPVHVDSQHTPSTHGRPSAHCEDVVQAAPCARLGTVQPPCASHRAVPLQLWPLLMGVPVHRPAPVPQKPPLQRFWLMLAGNCRQLSLGGQAMTPQAASSAMLVQLVPLAAQRRQAPSQLPVQHTRAPPAVAWQLEPAPHWALELHASPGPSKQPPCAKLQPREPQSSAASHCPPTQRSRLPAAQRCWSLLQTAASAQELPSPAHTCVALQGCAQHRLAPAAVGRQAPLAHSPFDEHASPATSVQLPSAPQLQAAPSRLAALGLNSQSETSRQRPGSAQPSAGKSPA